MKRNLPAVRLTLLGIALVVAAVSASNQKPVNWKELPPPFHTPSSRNGPQVVARPDGVQLQLPAGFVVEDYMTGFERPRFMILGPNHEILLSDSAEGPGGAVYALKDKQKKKILEGLDRPYGLQLHKEWLYVAEPTSLKRYKYDSKSMQASVPGEQIVSMEGFGQGHWTRTVVFNPENTKFYLTIGSKSNIDLGEDPMRAALHRYNPDGTGHETVATGLRNIIGLRFSPGTQDLWAAIQERDGLGDDLVSDYLAKIKEGGFYGWPIAYTGPHKEPRHENVDASKVAGTLYPDVLLGAHVAVLDILFYTAEQFPAQYRNGLFLAFHGSWNRSQRVGYKVAFIPFKDGKPTSGPQDFLSGWMLDPANRDVWGRPVGLLQLPDGSLLVTDDGGQKIWRVSYKG